MLSAGFEHGGNTLHRFLDGHPELYVYPFESMVGTPVSQNLLVPSTVPFRYGWPSFDSEISDEQAYHAFYDEEIKTFLRTPFRSKFKDCGMIMDEKERIDLFNRAVSTIDSEFKYCTLDLKGPRKRPTYIEAYFCSTFDAWKNYNRSGKETHYVGYNPMVHLDADKIFSDFPDAQIVYVSRNPWSAYADTLKRPFPYSLEKYCQVWNVAQLQALNYAAKYPDRFHLFKTEKLFEEKEATMRALLSCLGLSWSEKVLYPSFNGVELPTMYPWGTLKTPTTEVNLATANELSRDHKSKISAECGYMLQIWDYHSMLTKDADGNLIIQ